MEIVYEDAFNRFVEEINGLAAYQWWEGSVYSIFSVLAYPLAWSWLQWRRKRKIQQLREFVRSEYDHACLRSCRSRALYEGLKVAATSDLMLAYVDFFLGGDEKRADLPPRLHQRFPMCLVFGGDGSYMTPFSLHSDNILTCLMSQSVPPTICWLETHANPTLSAHGVRVDLACFQPTCGYRQFGLVVSVAEDEGVTPVVEGPNRSLSPEHPSSLLGTHWRKELDHLRVGEHVTTNKRIFGAILHTKSLQTLGEKKTICYPFSFIIHNTKPVGHQDLVGLVISVLLLGDFSLVLLALLLLYSFSLLDFFLVLFILPFGILFPFPAGINALFSHGPRRSAGLARVYALWNIMSLINVVVAFICGFVHYKTQSSPSKKHPNFPSWNFSMDESGWWMLPCGLVLFLKERAD
ncbi:hypothetical protein F0562_009627 [Nyssa sinensis]|uniref:Uncharacterized protein n=1 Tax=Nyssa sinensis TaxID=561372 RepID=A0A5J4ZZ45_9ASTE|nr:hypothetical protein F0562_009627 [Nyssa sinensis]